MTGVQVDAEHLGDAPESSKAAQRRMRWASSSRISCGPASTAIIDPLTSHLTYLAPESASTNPGLLTTPVFNSRPARPLPTPRTLAPGRQISCSPDGRWVVIFHANLPPNEGGILAIYPSTILSPAAIVSPVNPHATFTLPSLPLAIHHFPRPRIWTKDGRSPPCGPRPPLTHDSSLGPSFLVLISSAILLCFPHSQFEHVMIDTRGSALNPLSQSPRITWRMEMIQCPLHTRWRTTAGGAVMVPPDIGIRARRGWMGSVPGDEGVWVAYEAGREVKVVRVEVGEDSLKREYMAVTPLPDLPRLSVKKGWSTEMQGVVFVPLQFSQGEVKMENEGDDVHQGSRVGIVRILRETESISRGDPNASRNVVTRLELCGVQQGRVELADGFKEIEASSAEVIPTNDWTIMPKPLSSSTSPPGYSIIALHPLPDVPPHALVLAMINAPSGTILSHLNLLSTTDDAEAANWSAITGDSVNIREDLSASGLSLVVSQGTARGELGLVGLVNPEAGAVLVVSPRLASESVSNGDEPNSRNGLHAKDTATSIHLAMKQGVDWSDVVRASFGAVTKVEQAGLLETILKEFYSTAQAEDMLGSESALFKVQTALFSAVDDSRLPLAAEMFQLTEASSLFSRCASGSRNGRIEFDLDSVWPLLTLAEWVGSVLGQTVREAVVEQARLEWEEGDYTPQTGNSRLIYLLQPRMRALILRLHAQLHVFVTYVQNLDQAIPPPSAAAVPGIIVTPDPKATVLARETARDVLDREGIDLILWGKALESMDTQAIQNSVDSDPETKLPLGESDEMFESSLLFLSLSPIQSKVRSLLSSLPTPSSLFKAPYAPEREYDALTFEPFTPQTRAKAKIKCIRCGWRTAALHRGRGMMLAGKWGEWRREREGVCGCGGAWVVDLPK